MHRVRDLIGISFVNKGRDRSGMDCAGLAQEAMRRFGYEIDDMDVCCFDAIAVNALYEQGRDGGKWKRVDIPEPGDLVVMRLEPTCPNMVSHVGVYIGGGRMIHTLRKRESHIVRLDDPYWSRKAREWYRWDNNNKHRGNINHAP